jgi:nucleoside-diphosphate-sugar epimerase
MENIEMPAKKILLTGGTGFVGSNLAEALVKKGYDVRCLVRKKSNINFLQSLKVEFTYGDVTDPSSIKDALKDVKTVLHLAGILGKWGVSRQFYDNIHVKGTKHILEECYGIGVERFIFCGSAGVLGPIKMPPADESYPYQPTNVYEEVKTEAEKLVMSYKDKLSVTVIRPEFVYGPMDMHVLSLFKTIKNRKFLLIGAGDAFLHPTFVDDVTQSFLLCLKNPQSIGQIYLVTGERYVTVKEYADLVSAQLGMKTSWRKVPRWAASSVASVFESAGKVFKFEPALTRSKVKFFTENRAFTNSKAKNDLGYAPIKLEEGIKRTVEWYQINGYL